MTTGIKAKDREGLYVRSAWNLRRSGLLSVFALLSAVVSSSHVFAASQGVQFTSQVSTPNACIIRIIRDGDFGISADKKILSSKISGGRFGIAVVESRSNYRITALAPTGFNLGPANAAQNTTFQARFSGNRISPPRNFLENDGSVPIRPGGVQSLITVNVHLIATRTGSTFPSGTYQGTVVLRCE